MLPSLPIEIWCVIVGFGGSLALLPEAHQHDVAATKIQREMRKFMLGRKIVNSQDLPAECLVYHGARWRPGVLNRVHGVCFIQCMDNNRRQYCFLSSNQDWKMKTRQGVRIFMDSSITEN